MYLSGKRGNTRFVNDLIEKAKVALGLRIMKHPQLRDPSRDDLSSILPEDILAIKALEDFTSPIIPVDEKLLEMSLAELNALTGLEGV